MEFMSRIRAPENIEIASLKKKQAVVYDVMAPGAGTPWEDRGSHGVVGAFFKTVGMSLTRPGQMMLAIRRPETSGDVGALVIICSVFWALSALLHGLILLPHYRDVPQTDFDSSTYIEFCVIGMVAAGGAAWGLHRLFTMIYGKLVAQEKSLTNAPGVLLRNLTSYALVPSPLALIPMAGPPLALLMIAVNLIAAGRARLRLRMAAAAIDAMLALVAVLVVAFVGYWVGVFVLHQVLGDYSTVIVTHSRS